MCNHPSHKADEENLNANNMAASGILILAVLLLYVIYNEFANHHMYDRIESLFEDTGLHEVEPTEQ